MKIEFTTEQLTTLAVAYADAYRAAGLPSKETVEMRELSLMIDKFGTLKNFCEFISLVNIAVAS